jgi:hypothetical protein
MATRSIRYEIEPMTLGNMRELGVRSLDMFLLEFAASGRAQRRSLAG